MSNPLIGKKLVMRGTIKEEFLWAISAQTGVPPDSPLMTEELIRQTIMRDSSPTGLESIEFED